MVSGAGEPVVGDRFDITVEAVRRAGFDSLVQARVRADPGALIYGVTPAPGDRAAAVLDPGAQADRPARLWTAMSYGEPLPEKQGRHAPEALHGLVENVRATVSPVDEPRPLGAECQQLYARMTQAATGQAVPFV